MYAEFEGDECNSLDFQLGTTGIDATLPTNRGWNIKVLLNLNSIRPTLTNIRTSHLTMNFILIFIFLFQITQIDCDSNLRAPQGCTQYFYGSESQQVRSYNFNGGQGLHLG